MLKEKLDEYQSKFQDLGVNANLYINVARSYEGLTYKLLPEIKGIGSNIPFIDIAGETILNDAVLMPVGFMMVFVYIMVMLGKFDCINTRVIS